VGAGLTGGSAFSITAWVALAAMWAGAGLTDAVVDREFDGKTLPQRWLEKRNASQAGSEQDTSVAVS